MKKAVVVAFLCLSIGLGTTQAQLKVTFTVTNGPVEAGYQGYFATRSQPATFTAQSYPAFGATVTVQPTWGPGAANTAMAMINRTGSSTNRYTGAHADLINTWIGTDTRQIGNPMTLTISGLPAGTYSWLSYHHDGDNQTGQFEVTVNDAAGSATTAGIDISDSRFSGVLAFENITTFTTTIVSNGTSEITLVFRQTSANSPVEMAFFVMNGFELTDQATEPVPAHQATDVPRDGTILSWTPNAAAVAHDVYLGTDYDEIDDGMVGSSAYQGRHDATSFDPGRLELGKTYHWRVDEVFAGNRVTKGSIWSFTVEPISVALTGAHVKVTASSASSFEEGPEKTIDGSGLNADDQHAIETATMWLSHAGDPNAAWIQYEFDRVYPLSRMQVWNHNSMVESLIGLGIKEATVAYSLDGTEWVTLPPQEFARATGKADYETDYAVEFGSVAARYVKITAQSNWGGGILKQYGLSEVRFLVIPATARDPEPAADATDVNPQMVLNWRAGRAAAMHRVYLSTDANEVLNGTALVATVSEPRFDADGLLVLGQKYYWRVDEVNDVEEPSAWEGDVWSFSTTAQLMVDDMESYNDEEDQGTRIYETWLDGWTDAVYGGSQVGYAPDPPFAERTIVHGGSQSMPFYYDSSTAVYSDATRTFDPPQDWTRYGVKALTLWFYGAASNTSAQMYVTVNGRKVAYDSAAANLQRKPWQLWYVDVTGLAGVNLKRVTELTIGFEGGTGLVFFDDLGLSPRDRQLVTPVKPDAANLVAHYAFEGNTNSSAGGPAGTVVGAPQFVEGNVGQAIKLDGARDHIVVDGPFALPVYSFAAWFRVEGGAAERDLFSVYDAAGGHGILLEVRPGGELRYLHRSPVGTQGGTNVYSRPNFSDGAWYHVAAVKSADSMTLYINGEPAGTALDSTQFDTSLVKLALGVLKHDSLSRFFPGTIDEVYLYDRVLSQDEIAWLAGRTTPFDKP